MIFEKNALKRPISIELVGVISLLVIVTAYVTYSACVIFEAVSGYDSNTKITFIDLVNGVAQIATASAFVLAYIQFRKSRLQQRQMSIASEAKSQLEKMTTVISAIKLGEESCLKNLNKSISLLANLATNFDELFKAMHEDIQKAIVRMQWQDMYFNYLGHALNEIDPVIILKKETSIDRDLIDAIATKARTASESDEILPAFKEYVFVDGLLNHPKIKKEFSLDGKIDSLDMFTAHYLNDHNLRDLMYGLASKIDIKARAPLFAVAGPSKWALEKLP